VSLDFEKAKIAQTQYFLLIPQSSPKKGKFIITLQRGFNKVKIEQLFQDFFLWTQKTPPVDRNNQRNNKTRF